MSHVLRPKIQDRIKFAGGHLLSNLSWPGLQIPLYSMPPYVVAGLNTFPPVCSILRSTVLLLLLFEFFRSNRESLPTLL